MAQAWLTADDLKALDQTRQRLSQLTNNIASIKADVLQSNPMPQWPSLQASASILASNVQALTTHLSRHSELLSRMVAYPSTNYPGRTEESTLTMLLRKKLEPPVESWVNEGRAVLGVEKEEEELLGWAKDWIGARVATYALEEAGDNYTVEEREKGIEHVNTGLRRTQEEEEESEEDEDEEMEGMAAVTNARSTSLGQVEYGLEGVKKGHSGKARSFADILQLATTGFIPHSDLGRT